MRPSTGFVATVLAMQLCKRVSLFGLTSDPCRPFHYYGPPKKDGCTAAIPKENDEHARRRTRSNLGARPSPWEDCRWCDAETSLVGVAGALV